MWTECGACALGFGFLRGRGERGLREGGEGEEGREGSEGLGGREGKRKLEAGLCGCTVYI